MLLLRCLGLSLLLALLRICSSDEIPVISGVFMPNNITKDYNGAKAACALHYSRLATLEQITKAFKNGYEFCKWGWIEEHKIVMLRLTPFLPCSNYNLGILIRDCPNIFAAFCANATDDVGIFSMDANLIPSFENASLTCSNQNRSIATKVQVEARASVLREGISAWYDWGVGQVQGGALVADVCSDMLSKASAFCYNPDLADFIIKKDDQTVKKIIIGCLLALIFLLLLAAAACMRGNRFVCCMARPKTQPPDAVTAPQPTWNTTSIYRRISQVHRDMSYDNAAVEKRPAIIRPDMNVYKTHYSNMGFDTTGEE